MSYEQRVAVVSGSTSGLGRAVLQVMAEAGLEGAIVVGRNEQRGQSVVGELEELGTAASFVRVDLTDPGAPNEIVGRCLERHGRVDVLVNAAARTTRNRLVEETVDHFEAMMATNVRAPFFLMQAAVRAMIEAGIPGAIVNVGSVAGYVGAPHLAAYSASKAALKTVTLNAADSLAPHRIRVNQVNPGWMDTPSEDEIQRRFHGATDGWQERAGQQLPFGRLIDPMEVARLIAYVASDAAGLMTGAIIDFDQRVVGAID